MWILIVITLALGGLAGYKVGEWNALRRLGAAELRDRLRRIGSGGR